MKNKESRLPGTSPFIPGLLSLLFFCSCATTPSPAVNPAPAAIPADTSFNKGAGRGNPLYITLHLESGEKLLFSVDTGSPGTILDKSLEPKLGKRLSSTPLWYGYYGISGFSWARVYQAPALYLGTTRLVTDDRICTDDLRTKSDAGHPLMGILGMDCLKHYCLQLDFDSATLHFFDPDHLETEGLGKALPLTVDTGNTASVQARFFGAKESPVWFDTGDSSDGMLTAGLFNSELRRQKTRLRAPPETPQDPSLTCFPEGEFDGETYTNLSLHKGPLLLSLMEQKSIGLQFLARHLVTANFPKQMLYLQRRSVGPLPDGMAALKESLGFVNGRPPKDLEERITALFKQNPKGSPLDAGEFLKNLKKDGRLPGWRKDELGTESIGFDPDWLFELRQGSKPEDYPLARTVMLFKKDDPASYNYTVLKASPDAPWQLQRAWKAAPEGRILKDYPIQ